MTAGAAVTRPLMQEAEPGGARAPRHVGVVLASCIMAVGVLGIAGNIAGWTVVLAPVSGWPELRALPALTLVALGAALLAMLRANRQVAITTSAVAAALGVVGTVAALGTIHLPLGGMSLTTALLDATAACAMVIASASPTPRNAERALGIAGFVVVALVLTLFGAAAVGLLNPFGDVRAAGSSLQWLLSGLALGLYLLGLLWATGRFTLESADWLPGGAGFASLLAVLVVSRALSMRETAQLETLTRQAGASQIRAMNASVRGLARSLARAAEWRASGVDLQEQTRDLKALQRDVQGMQGGVFISTTGAHQVLARTAQPLPGLDSVWRSRTVAGKALADSIRYWPLDGTTSRFAIVAPSCTHGVCDGAIVGVLETNALFAPLLADTSLGFYHVLAAANGSGATEAPAGRLPAASSVSLPVQFGDVKLQLVTWPTRVTVAGIRSRLPAAVLVMGTLVSALLVMTTLLGQGARRLATTRERARLASVLERATDGIWEWDLATGAAEHSTGIWKNLGYEAASAVLDRASWLAVVHPDDLDGFNRALTRTLNGEGETFEHEYRVRSRSGEWHTMVDRARVVERTPAGEPLRLLGVRADVTEARHAHAARILNERRFRAIFDSGFQYQLLLDRDGQVLEVNRVALEACHAAVDDVVGQLVWSTLWWASTEVAREPLQRALEQARQGTAARYEADVHCGDASNCTLEIAVKPLLDRAGQTNEFLLEARDITVRRRADAALQEVDTLTTMGRVAARVAHEINNPLAGIQNSFLLIKGAVPPTHPHFAYVGAIEREIDRIAAVTRQLYETYRPEQDMGGGTSVRSLVADALSFLAQVNRGMQVRVETDFAGLPGVIRLPSAMLRQIFYNLAQNAIEASPAGEVVTVQGRLANSTFCLSVRDRGAGIPPELHEKIFEPFFSTKDRGVRSGGMGLGLALVRRTVVAAGGTIAISDAPDGGTVFTVTLPVPAGAQGEGA